VVFVTAHEKYAVEAFATSAVDYLVKPVNPERLAETIRRLGEIAAIQRLKSAATGGDASLPDDKEADDADDATASAAAADRDSTTNVGPCDTISVPLRAKGRAAMVPIGDICWIESFRNSTRVCLMNPSRILFFRRRLGEWEADLPAGLFERLGKSLVVQLALIQETEWKSRDETVLTFAADIEPLVIGRMAAMRLRDVLGEGGDGLA
jgi:two-component system LytT family response regulator